MEELERLAILGTRAQKVARRDIAHVVSSPLFSHLVIVVSFVLFIYSCYRK